MKVIFQVFCTIFSAFILILAIPNEIFLFGCPFLALFALIPFYIAYTNFSSPANAAFLTGLLVFLVHLGSSYWLAFFKDFAIFTLGASALGTAGIGSCVGLILYSPFLCHKNYDTPPNLYKRSLSSPAPLMKCERFGPLSLVPFRALWFCVVYTFYELVKSCGWFGYPWGTVSSCFYQFKILIQIVDITGTYGVTFLVLLFTVAVGEGFLCCDTKAIKQLSYLTIAFFILSFVYGVYQFTKPVSPIKSLNTIIVQQNSDPWKESTDNESITLSQRLTREEILKARENGDRVDLVVWSEGCLKKSFPRAQDYYEYMPLGAPLLPFIRSIGVPFLLGGSYREREVPRRVINAAILFDKNATLSGVYGKNHLVPCAEVLPFSDIPSVSAFWKKTIGISAGWATGNQYVYFDVPASPPPAKKNISKTIYLDSSGNLLTRTESNKPYQKRFYGPGPRPFIDPADDTSDPLFSPRVRFSAPICFGDAFPDVCRPLVNYGSELFMNITDDSWSKTRSSEYQHFVIAAFRAIELRTTLARSTNSGVSVVVDRNGVILDTLPLFEACAGFFKIPIYKRVRTTYLKLGNWLPNLCLLLVVLVELYYLILMHLKKSSPATPVKKPSSLD